MKKEVSSYIPQLLIHLWFSIFLPACPPLYFITGIGDKTSTSKGGNDNNHSSTAAELSSLSVLAQVVCDDAKSSNGGGARGRCAYNENCVMFKMPCRREQCSGHNCQNYVHKGCQDHYFNSESLDDKNVYCKGCHAPGSKKAAGTTAEQKSKRVASSPKTDVISEETVKQVVSQPLLVEMTTRNKVGQEFCIMYATLIGTERFVVPYFGTVTSIINYKGNIVVTCQWEPFHSYMHPDREDPLVICQKEEKQRVSVALENWNKGFDMESSWIMGNKSDFAKLCPQDLRGRFKVRIVFLLLMLFHLLTNVLRSHMTAR